MLALIISMAISCFVSFTAHFVEARHLRIADGVVIKYQVAKNASAAAEGLCTWVRAMKFYHEASKIVKPKLEALAVAEGQMDAANKVTYLARTEYST